MQPALSRWSCSVSSKFTLNNFGEIWLQLSPAVAVSLSPSAPAARIDGVSLFDPDINELLYSYPDPKSFLKGRGTMSLVFLFMVNM